MLSRCDNPRAKQAVTSLHPGVCAKSGKDDSAQLTRSRPPSPKMRKPPPPLHWPEPPLTPNIRIFLQHRRWFTYFLVRPKFRIFLCSKAARENRKACAAFVAARRADATRAPASQDKSSPRLLLAAEKIRDRIFPSFHTPLPPVWKRLPSVRLTNGVPIIPKSPASSLYGAFSRWIWHAMTNSKSLASHRPEKKKGVRSDYASRTSKTLASRVDEDSSG